MNPVAVMYPHGAGGRFLGVVVQSLFEQTTLNLPNSGHGNRSIKYFRPNTSTLEIDPFSTFDIVPEHVDQQIELLSRAWQELSQHIPINVIHTDLINPIILRQAIPEIRIVRITAEPEDAWDLGWNWTIKNLDHLELHSHQERTLDIFRTHQQDDCLNDEILINADILESIDTTDNAYWATLRGIVFKQTLEEQAISFPESHEGYVYSVAWKDIKSGKIKLQLPDIAKFLNIDLLADRKVNAEHIIDQWVANQIIAPIVHLSV